AAVVPAAAAAPAHAAPRPIVYAIVIDGLDGDRVDQGDAPFISSLIAGQQARTTYFRESRSIMVAETNPNHTAMMTGAYAGRSGIFSNTFAVYAPLENEDSCRRTGPVDYAHMPTETSGENANCVLAQTVFEAIKRQGNPDRLATAAIFGKPKLGRIFAGARVDPPRHDVDHLWAPCSSGPEDDGYCGDVPTNPISGYAIDDKTVMDEVIRTIRQGIRADGRVKRPDFTFVNLHQTDSAGHAFTPDSGVYDVAIGMADDEIERLVNELRSRGEWQRTVLVLLSDHSMDTTPTKTSVDESFDSAGISDDRYLVIGKSSVDQIYLANRVSPNRFALLKRMRAAALSNPGVREALYREPNPADGGAAHTIAGVHPGWQATGGDRTPDLFLTHNRGGSFADPDPADQPFTGHHGAPQTRDNFLAVVGGGAFVRQHALAGRVVHPFYNDTLVNVHQSENVDVAPTVMGAFGLFAPSANRGRFLAEAFDRSALPGAAKPARPSLTVRRVGKLRSAAACAGRRYRLDFAPAGGRYDLTVRSGGANRTLLRRSRRTSFVFSARAGETYLFSLRSRSAANVASDAARAARTVPRC
ncbi:MAG TPA: alkaline phosphatase family protein, partial [Thermoleophilaceae bacterium]|nr:alkaline phosphatase family protein [Thermoleophilaceae bacterium]